MRELLHSTAFKTELNRIENGNTAKHPQLTSLYYSFTVDTTTNLMSKLPHRLQCTHFSLTSDLYSHGLAH